MSQYFIAGGTFEGWITDIIMNYPVYIQWAQQGPQLPVWINRISELTEFELRGLHCISVFRCHILVRETLSSVKIINFYLLFISCFRNLSLHIFTLWLQYKCSEKGKTALEDRNAERQSALCSFSSATEIHCSVAANNSVGAGLYRNNSTYTKLKSRSLHIICS